MQPDVFDLLRVDRRQRLGHAVDERLAADEPGARMVERLRDQVLTAAEADLEADVVDRTWKERGEIVRRPREIDREPRQQRLEQPGLMRAQGMALAAAEECAVTVRLVVAHGARQTPTKMAG